MPRNVVLEVFRKAGLEPRRGQLEAAEAIASVLAGGGSVAFVAPTGFGKTIAVLAGLVASERLPVVWRVRSLALGSRVLGDAALLDLAGFVAAGRERTCPLASRLGGDVHEYCRGFRLSCKYFLETDFSRPVLAADWRELLNARGCPYYLQERAMEDAQVVVMSYYRRPPRYYRSIVYDEAHNLLAPRESCIPAALLAEAAAELKTVGEDRLARWLSQVRPRVEGPFAVEEEKVLALQAAYRKLLSQGYGRTATGKVYRVLGSEAVYWESGRLCGARLALPAPRPSSVYVSATLPYPELLGTRETIEIPWTRRRKAYITGWLTTRYGKLDENVEGYARLLTALKLRVPRVLAFATRRVANAVRRRVAVDYYEPELRVVPAEWKGVMLLHSRGRFAEGVDIRADAVVVLGAPFLPPHASRRLERALRGTGVTGDIRGAAMLSTTLQCIGRATRKPSDDPLIILADKRYTRYTSQLNKYYALDRIADLGDFVAVVKKFRAGYGRIQVLE